MPIEWPQVPYLGIGCIIVHAGRVLLVRNQGGLWCTPGGHLDFGESPAEAAIREKAEETGVSIDGVAFVAVTNDVMVGAGKHYVTIWMRGETSDPTIAVRDPEEIEEAGWFDPAALPTPRHLFFENLLARRTLPPEAGQLGAPGAASRPVRPARPEHRGRLTFRSPVA